jgi:hypothetical protein
LAFVRRRGTKAVLTAVRRFPVRSERNRDWGGTMVRTPRALPAVREVLTGRVIEANDALDPETLFAVLPIAVLAWEDKGERAGRP